MLQRAGECSWPACLLPGMCCRLQQPLAAALFRTRRRDELLALEAIYSEAVAVREDQGGFTMTVVPHPGEAEENYVSVQLIVRWAPHMGAPRPCTGSRLLVLPTAFSPQPRSRALRMC